MADIGTAYIQIVPSAKGIKGSLEKEIGGDAIGTSVGNSIGSKIKGALVAAGIGTALVGVIKGAIGAGSELEQNLGGSEAVFGDYFSTVQTSANQAYTNMGMSASDYMATINKMGSLFQGSGISQQKSLDLSTQAMQRAADVASIMGIDTSMAMESIAGAAKGNFTMMDNLGVAMNATTLEAYALEKGINFKWNTADNAQKAELAMQMFMDRTSQYEGNFARESEQTFSGSLGAMKAAAENLMGNLALGNDITPQLVQLRTTVMNFMHNLVPMIENVLRVLIPLLPEILTEAVGLLAEFAPQIISTIASVIPQLMSTLVANIPTIINSLVQAVVACTPQLVQGAIMLAMGLVAAIPQIIIALVAAIPQIIDGLIQGFAEAWPAFVESVNQLWEQLSTSVSGALGSLIETGSAWLQGLWTGITSFFPQLWANVQSGAAEIKASLISSLGDLLEAGYNWLSGLWSGIVSVASSIVANVAAFGQNLFNNLKSGIGNLFSIGANWLQGLWNGINNKVAWVISKVKGVGQQIISAAKSVFGIASPSKVMEREVGRWIPAGIAVGIKKNIGVVNTVMDQIRNDAMSGITATVHTASNYGINEQDTVMGEVVSLLSIIADKNTDVTITYRDRELTRSLRDLGVQFA